MIKQIYINFVIFLFLPTKKSKDANNDGQKCICMCIYRYIGCIHECKPNPAKKNTSVRFLLKQ